MLLAEQAASALRMTPAVSGAALVVIVTIVANVLPTSGIAAVTTWALVVAGLHLLLLREWSATLFGQTAWKHGAMPWRVVAAALAVGAAWSSILFISPLTDPHLIATLIGGLGGMFCLTVLAMANFPQASLAFAVTFAIGVVGALVSANGIEAAAPHTLLFFAGLLLVGVISVQHARTFVSLHRADVHASERDTLIALLLRENDPTASDWLWGIDRFGRIDRASTGFGDATGLAIESLKGADFIEFLSAVTLSDDVIMRELRRDMTDHKSFTDLDLHVAAANSEYWWRLTGKPVFDENGTYLGYIGTGSDISERKLAEARMAHLAHNDPLTGLLNRTKFTDSLNQCVARLERYGTPFALLYLDLDNFKLVNDSRGHLVGDRLLSLVAERIVSTVRSGDQVARLGGDEFAVILTSDCHAEYCASIARRLIDNICKSFDIDGESLSIGVSIGIAVAPQNGTRPDQLQRNADLALYRAKDDGRSVFRFFESHMDSDARERRLLELELRDAMRKNELILHYQPVVSAENKQPTGFEALIRWQHPIRGLVPPSEFIPIAEQSALILEIGSWTIEEACRAAASWPEDYTVAVNLSAKHFRLADIAMVVHRALALSGLEPRRLELEITETLLVANPDEVTKKLEELRAIGVTIVMDDFGTGYSSLSYLLKFPFDKIKIDRSFVSASTEDPMARDILRAIASLGATLKLMITAEGVETQEQAEFLSEIACHNLQGFFFARPLDNTSMPAYLRASPETREHMFGDVVAVDDPVDEFHPETHPRAA